MTKSDGRIEGGRDEAETDTHERPVARFIHDHPGMAVAGGIVLGLLAAALIPRRNRNFVAEKSSALADAISAAGLMIYREALENAGTTGKGVRSLADRIGDRVHNRSADGDGEDTSAEPRLSDALTSLLRKLPGRSRD